MKLSNLIAGILSVSLMLPFAAAAQQSVQSPELTALAVAQWVTSIAQENAMLRDQVASLRTENAKLKEAAKPTAPEAPK